ncbi:MAG: hypothetical protein ACK56I_01200, partial [bacterium]
VVAADAERRLAAGHQQAAAEVAHPRRQRRQSPRRQVAGRHVLEHDGAERVERGERQRGGVRGADDDVEPGEAQRPHQAVVAASRREAQDPLWRHRAHDGKAAVVLRRGIVGAHDLDGEFLFARQLGAVAELQHVAA